MSTWSLPESVDLGGAEYPIRTDFRAVLDIMTVLEDPEISDDERGELACRIFYCDFDSIPEEHRQDAAERLMWFVQGGDSPARPPKRKLVDWKQDFPIIVGPVNRVLGYEVREREHVHWWTFLSAYMEVGDCLFAQVVSIRSKKSKGKQLDKHDREFYRSNSHLVDFERKRTEAEEELLSEWM